jgi:hypothetical protein
VLHDLNGERSTSCVYCVFLARWPQATRLDTICNAAPAQSGRVVVCVLPPCASYCVYCVWRLNYDVFISSPCHVVLVCRCDIRSRYPARARPPPSPDPRSPHGPQAATTSNPEQQATSPNPTRHGIGIGISAAATTWVLGTGCWCWCWCWYWAVLASGLKCLIWPLASGSGFPARGGGRVGVGAPCWAVGWVSSSRLGTGFFLF